MTMKSAVLLTLISAKYANGLTRGSSSSTLDFNDKGLRQLQMENGAAAAAAAAVRTTTGWSKSGTVLSLAR